MTKHFWQPYDKSEYICRVCGLIHFGNLPNANDGEECTGSMQGKIAAEAALVKNNTVTCAECGRPTPVDETCTHPQHGDKLFCLMCYDPCDP